MREHRPTSLVIGPDWQQLQRSLAYRLARLLGEHAQLVPGSPVDVMNQLLNMHVKERRQVRLLVWPYVLHDFAHEGLHLERAIGDVADAFPRADFLLADYAIDGRETDEDLLSALTAQIERDRIAELGRERFLEEHRAFTPARLRELFEPHGQVRTEQFGLRTVLRASRPKVQEEPSATIELARRLSRTAETASIA